MKKTYMQPMSRLLLVETQQLLAASQEEVSMPINPHDGTKEVLSKDIHDLIAE